jgi:hypothetical protein
MHLNYPSAPIIWVREHDLKPPAISLGSATKQPSPAESLPDSNIQVWHNNE